MLARAALACFAVALAATPAAAIKMDGDDYADVLQKNPAFLEPGAEDHPARYRIGDPRDGYDERVRAQIQRERPYRGDVRVRPYGY